MQIPSMITRMVFLLGCVSPCSAARARLRAMLPHQIDPTGDAISPLHSVNDVAETVEDMEIRQKPPHVLAHEIDKESSLLAGDLIDLLNENRDDMQNCIIVHQYAEPLMVGDAVHELKFTLSRDDDNKTRIQVSDDGDDDDDDDDGDGSANVTGNSTGNTSNTSNASNTNNTSNTSKKGSRNGSGNATRNNSHSHQSANGSSVDLPPLVKQGAIWDDSPTSNNVPLAVEVFADLVGMTGLVQVIPHGIMARWTSKKKVPIGGFLCTQSQGVPSAPVLHAFPTPCVPTMLDSSGMPLDPIADGYEVFVGETRLRFDNKSAAEKFCVGYATRIATDLSTNEWDASSLGEKPPGKNPSLTSFVSVTGRQLVPGGWTKGRKSILVVVMDWMLDDNSLEPFSKQESNPIPNYQTKIFPEVNRQFERMSYGQFSLNVTFVPEVIRYNRQRQRYSGRKMPFPALYEAARESLQGQRDDYNFDSYDLVYVIAPQVKPIGTKGVAWVGMKGAMCNGCETISDSFKIMVAVHELGHNLGLQHASSSMLEYGNPFDWMGNYPDVKGLNYGEGYMWSLGWIPEASVYTIRDADLIGLSTMVSITPHDAERASGEAISGVRVSLSQNSRDLWISFRALPNKSHNGVFLTLQDKEEANSELIDAACHSPSQQDANLRMGWYYMDPSHSIGVKVMEVSEKRAKVQVFQLQASDISKIYGEATFSDGKTKCPRTCQDADWLLAGYNCSGLRDMGYCPGGKITMQGRKYDIGTELCPQTCGNCAQVLKQSLQLSAGCSNRNTLIGGKTCSEAASAGWCSYEVNSGSFVGRDLCPESCGECPKVVTPSSAGFFLPAPRKQVGFTAGDTWLKLVSNSSQSAGAVPASGPAAPASDDDDDDTDDNSTTSGGPPMWSVATTTSIGSPAASPAAAGAAAAPASPASDDDDDDDDDDDAPCHDDPSWTDKDGDSCADYADIIDNGTWNRTKACSYDGAAASDYCRKTCRTCLPNGETCADHMCISTFKKINGRCEQCRDWSRFCNGTTASWFRNECPLTCGVCKPKAITAAAAAQEDSKKGILTRNTCGDDKCVSAWKTPGKCPTCKELGSSFCSEEVFAKACRGTCNLCRPEGSGKCQDVFSRYTCTRYKTYGWCTRDDMKAAVQKQCPESCGLCANATKSNAKTARSNAARRFVSVACMVAVTTLGMFLWEATA